MTVYSSRVIKELKEKTEIRKELEQLELGMYKLKILCLKLVDDMYKVGRYD